MKLFEILLIVGCALFVAGVVVAAIFRKKRGKSGCDCCSDCAHCSHCGHGADNAKIDSSSKNR